MTADPADTIDVKAPSKAEFAVAEGARAAAHLSHLRTDLALRLSEPFDLEDESMAEDGDAVLVRARAQARAKERMLILCETFKSLVVNAEAAGAAADTIIAVEDECEREKRVLQALLERCERRAEWTRVMLWGALEVYASKNPRSLDGKGKPTKSWKLPWTTARLTERTAEAKVEVVDRTRCLAWVKSVIGSDRAIDLDIVKVEETIRVGPLRDYVEAHRTMPEAKHGALDPASIPGAKYDPAGERLTLYRK